MTALFKLFLVFALSSVKFLFAPALSYSIGLNFLQTWASTSLGGAIGVVIFFYFSRWILGLYKKYVYRYVSDFVHHLAHKFDFRELAHKLFPRQKKIFSFKSRAMVKIRRKYGLAGIVILTPVLLSIPLGAFLAARYYGSSRFLVLYLVASVAGWSLLMSGAIAIF